MSKAPFPIVPAQTGIAIAYRNEEYVADMVLPRKTVDAETFKFWRYNVAEAFTIPDTRVGRKSKPNEVEFSATEDEASTSDYGLNDPIPYSDIRKAELAGYDPRLRAVEGIMDLVLLDRELRTANIVFNANTYPVGNKVTLSGVGQWSDYVNSDPVSAILNALDVPMMRPNTLVFGQSPWTVFRQHPKVVKATNKNSGDAGAAAKQAVAELFEVNQIIIGKSRLNSAKKGQAASLARVWGKHCAMLYLNPLADNQRGITFGFTAQYGTRIAGSYEKKDIGLEGGEIVGAGEKVKELIIAADTGYFFQNAVA